MRKPELNPEPDPGVAERFATTHWSVVLLAGQQGSAQAAEALEKLCRTYWYPLYAYVRRQGYDPADAQDLTQEFFSRLLASNELGAVDRRKGKFRSFLLGTMRHLLANEWHRSQRQKRGGGSVHFSLEALAAEDRYQLDPPEEKSPEEIFERRWAETVIDAVTGRLEQEFAAAGEAERFEELKGFLLADEPPTTYAESARRLRLSAGAVRSAIYRMRQRYGELFRAELAKTVTSVAEMEEEIRHFLRVLEGET